MIGSSSAAIAHRLSFFRKGDYYLIAAFDHFLSSGKVADIDRVATINFYISRGLISGFVANPGLLGRHAARLKGPCFLQTMGIPEFSDIADKIIHTSPLDAMRLGATGVAVQLNFQAERFDKQFSSVCEQTRSAHSLGLPVLLMINKWPNNATLKTIVNVLHACSEVGVDLIKTPPLSENLLDEPNINFDELPPVVFAGGDFGSFDEALARLAFGRGYKGFCLGRNLFDTESGARLVEAIIP